MQSSPYCLVLEYLDLPLSALDPAKYKENSVFMAAFFKGMLEGAKDIALTKKVWTGEYQSSPGDCLFPCLESRNR